MLMDRSGSCLKKRTSEQPPTPGSILGIDVPTFSKIPTLFRDHDLENQHNRWVGVLRGNPSPEGAELFS